MYLEYRPINNRRYVDDIFILFKSFDHLKRFQSDLNSLDRTINYRKPTIKNKLLVVHTPILIAFYLIPKKLV